MMKLKVISLNIWMGGNLFAEALEFLKQQDADILALQEVHDSSDQNLAEQHRTFSVLKAALGYEHADFVPAFINNLEVGKVPEGNAIFSKYPITARDHVFLNEPFNDNYYEIPENYASQPHTLQHVVIQTAVGDINYYNVHGVWDLDGDNYSDRRQQMSRVILDQVKGQKNIILGGDTNAKPTNQAMLNIAAAVPSVFGTTVKSTFNMRRKDNPGYATAAVDMLFASPNIKVLQKDVPDVDISDHLPLIVTFSL